LQVKLASARRYHAEFAQMARLFFALLPETIERAALHALACAWSARSGGRAPGANDLHLTLCFIGEVADTRMPALCEAAASVRANALELGLRELDYWPQARVLCAIAGVDEGSRSAAQLAAAIVAAVSQAGFAPDGKPFRPHLTLVRKVVAASIAGEAWPQPLATPVVLRCDRFVLVRSDAGLEGSVYTHLQSWPLTPGTPPPTVRNFSPSRFRA
jgi:2'-5' RNA ligase